MALLGRGAMRKSRFTDERIVAVLREADRTSVAEAAKKNKVSEQSVYSWRNYCNEPLHSCSVLSAKRVMTWGSDGRGYYAVDAAAYQYITMRVGYSTQCRNEHV
jgi:hypothetical protein